MQIKAIAIMNSTESQLYYEAANIIRKVEEKRGTIKTLVYSSGFKDKNLRQLFALVNECMKSRCVVGKVASACPKSLHSEPAMQGDFEVVIVLLYEYLLGRKFGKAVGLRRLFQKHKAGIKSAVDKVVNELGTNTLKEACQIHCQESTPKIPRYMRVNLIKSSVDAVIKNLQSESWEFVGKFTQDEFSTRALEMPPQHFGLDPVLPDLLVFPPGTDLHDHALTRSGVLVQQDRASCIPAHALNPTPTSTVLDCCAAPGNKTSHLASLMKNEGQVIALDRDLKRLGTMRRLLSNSGATCVELIHQDFLTVEPTSADAENIQFILVDPSCSGSGMFTKQTATTDSDRIQTLKRFQISILKHALQFPNVKRVMYSTCSVHQEENEEVAEEVMSQVNNQYRFSKVLAQWKGSRGIGSFPHAKFFLRLSPAKDLTQGFFVACFERVTESVVEGDNNPVQIDSQDQTDTKAKIRKQKRKNGQLLQESRDTETSVVEEGLAVSGIKRKKKRKQEINHDTPREHEHSMESTELMWKKKKRKSNGVRASLRSHTLSLRTTT